MEELDFETDQGLGSTAKIGLVVLQSDQTIEHDFTRIFDPDPNIVLYKVRIPNSMEVSEETLQKMEEELPTTVSLLPTSFDFDVIGYACTSGATVIGEQRVDSIIKSIHPGVKTTNPITAVKASLSALNLKRIALVTPYAPEVTMQMQYNLKEDGYTTNAVATFNESDDFTVGRIAPKSILEAVVRIGASHKVDGVFISCTNLRTLDVIEKAEIALNKPVISSNQALAWHLSKLAGLTEKKPSLGKLFWSA